MTRQWPGIIVSCFYFYWKVESTLDLEKKIQSKLMAISGRRHAGVWNSSSFDFQQVGRGLVNHFIPEFLKWTPPYFNLNTSILL